MQWLSRGVGSTGEEDSYRRLEVPQKRPYLDQLAVVLDKVLGGVPAARGVGC
jgi:hypothetical protein